MWLNRGPDWPGRECPHLISQQSRVLVRGRGTDLAHVHIHVPVLYYLARDTYTSVQCGRRVSRCVISPRVSECAIDVDDCSLNLRILSRQFPSALLYNRTAIVPSTPRIPSKVQHTMAVFSAVPPPPALVGGVDANPHDNAQQQQQQHAQGESHAADTANNLSSLPPNAAGVDIAAWTISALESLSVSPVARGTGAPFSIPLDGTEANAKKEKDKEKPSVSIYDPRTRSSAITPPPRPLSRRDSLKRRDALLRGNEGSRQRRRWENGTGTPIPSPFSLSSIHTSASLSRKALPWTLTPRSCYN